MECESASNEMQSEVNPVDDIARVDTVDHQDHLEVIRTNLHKVYKVLFRVFVEIRIGLKLKVNIKKSKN